MKTDNFGVPLKAAYVDKLGQPVKTGDTIVFSRVYSTRLKTGVIKHFTPSGFVRVSVKYQWSNGVEWYTEIICSGNFIKIKEANSPENEVRIMSMSGKTSDCFYASLKNIHGKKLGEYDGYVPKFMPGNHYGDYVELEIDVVTGQILNWTPPSQEQLQELIQNDEE